MGAPEVTVNSVLLLKPRSVCVVIHAAHLFESSAIALKAALPRTANHGRGLVVGVDGLFRWVKFETQICKQSDELEPEEFRCTLTHKMCSA